MDGVAVRSRETTGATETSPVRLAVGSQAVWLDTGDPIPDGFDAVIMVEVVHEVDGTTIEVQAPVPPNQHVRALGEDIAAMELLLPQGHRLRPQDLAACGAAGLDSVEVRRRPVVAVIPTGNELVEVGSSPEPSQIIETNGLMLAAMVEEWGATSNRLQPVQDKRESLKAAVAEAVEASDIVLVNAGSSAGSEDYTAAVVEEAGDLLVHGIAIRPGHPVVLGVVQDKPVIGIPGYPVSAAITCEVIVRPIIERMLGLSPSSRQSIEATMSRKVTSPIGEDEYLRVRMGRVDGKMIATPIQRGAGVITSMVRADGLVRVPRFLEGLDAGSQVSVDLLRPAHELERTIVASGSHDLVIDLLASELRRTDPTTTLSSSNVGSLGGLLALGRGEAHLAGCHLLDEQSGEYNVAFVPLYVQGGVVLVNLVHRTQGLIVARGNPKSVSTLADLARDDVTFVNRQRGSGTRVLLDYMLKSAGFDAGQVRGYEREEYTHLAVAAAVSAGRADAGMGLLSAARATGLEFVSLHAERYDLVMSWGVYESDLLQPMLQLIRSQEFKSKVEALGGYDVSNMGEVVAAIS
jgi:putative molybdopterin biosynthesis protein